jgi:hypothetical protein
MTEPLAEDTAPEPEATAAPEPEIETPEDVKTFRQDEIDEIVAKRLARERRKWERDLAPPPQVRPSDVPQTDDPEVLADFIEQEIEARLQERAHRAEAASAQDAYIDREDAARERYADFDQVARNPTLPVTNDMAQVIMSADNGPDILYHLGSHPAEARRIANLSPLLQAREIGRLETRLASTPPTPKRTTSAPAPISPVTTKTATTQYDTSDPRSIQTMGTAAWLEAEQKRRLREAGG